MIIVLVKPGAMQRRWRGTPGCEHYYEVLRKPEEVPDRRVSLNSSVKCERRCVFANANTS